MVSSRSSAFTAKWILLSVGLLIISLESVRDIIRMTATIIPDLSEYLHESELSHTTRMDVEVTESTVKRNDFADVTRTSSQVHVHNKGHAESPPSHPQQQNSTLQWIDPLKENRTFFGVHLGKAGGSTVFSNMRRVLPLGNWHQKHMQFLRQVKRQGPNEMAASNKTIGLVHILLSGPLENRAHANAFLWVIRDPFDRIASAFYHQHPENKKRHCNQTISIDHRTFYCYCYHHVDDFVSDSVAADTTPAKMVVNHKNMTVNCRNLAKNISTPIPPQPFIMRDFRVYSHLNRNYEYYYNATIGLFPDKDIFIIRTEHLWDDLQQLEYSLGGNASIGKETHNFDSHGSESYKLKKKLTDPVLMQKFCCKIRREAEIYIELLQKAVNLQSWQKKQSLDTFAKRCNLDLCSTVHQNV